MGRKCSRGRCRATRPARSQPAVVAKHQRRLAGFDDAVLSPCAKGMTTGDVATHCADVQGTDVCRELVSKVTDAVGDLQEWKSRPLDAIARLPLPTPRTTMITKSGCSE